MITNLEPDRAETMKNERLLSKNFILVMLASTSTSIMNQFFNTSSSLHITAVGGLQVHAGMILTAYTTMALAARPISGILSDKYGRVKPLIIGAFVCALCCFLYGISSAIVMLVVIRCFMGIGFGMHSTCAGAAAADVLPKSRMAEGIGIFGLGGTLAQALAPMIALYIIGDGTLANFRLLFFVTSGLCVLGMVANCFNTSERKRKKNAVTSNASDSGSCEHPVKAVAEPLPKTLLGFEYAVFAPMAVMILLYMGFSALTLYLTPFARNMGIANPGLYFLANSVGVLVSRFIFGKVTDRYGNDVVVIPGIALFLILMAIHPFITSLPALIAIAFPTGIVQGAVIPTFNALVFRRCSAARRGSASSSFFAAFDIGYAVGAPLLGAIADARDYRFVFWAASILMALALGLYILIASDRVHNKRQLTKEQP